MDDLISRQAAIEALEKNYEPDMEFGYALADIPAADVRENVKGEWIYTPVENGMIIAMCSICKKVSAITPSVKEWYRFCPNCGADMRGEA